MAELLVKTLVRPFMTIPDRLNTSTGCLVVASAIRVSCLFCHYRSCHVGKPCRGARRPVPLRQADGSLLGGICPTLCSFSLRFNTSEHLIAAR
ncbi:hypothetical protein E4630_09165 [Aeromonas hydrophila]|nr:hypothetical protein E4625_09235 [Aeromonas hydrophila]QBX75723.1 hypothetical protein E4630_09165 [Aeromonas hydrophila]